MTSVVALVTAAMVAAALVTAALVTAALVTAVVTAMARLVMRGMTAAMSVPATIDVLGVVVSVNMVPEHVGGAEIEEPPAIVVGAVLVSGQRRGGNRQGEDEGAGGDPSAPGAFHDLCLQSEWVTSWSPVWRNPAEPPLKGLFIWCSSRDQ